MLSRVNLRAVRARNEREPAAFAVCSVLALALVFARRVTQVAREELSDRLLR